MKTQVGIIGAGPAGLLLAIILNNNGIKSIVLERQSENYVRSRNRAGIIEQTSVDILIKAGVGKNIIKEGIKHEGVFFHYDDKKKFVDLKLLNPGKTVTAYSQKKLINDLLDKAQLDAIPVVFEAEAQKIKQEEGYNPIIHFTNNKTSQILKCDIIAGCDGFNGISRVSIPNHEENMSEKIFPYALLGILSNTPPITNNIIFAHHFNGFAVQSMRGKKLTKFYLQCPIETDVDNWGNDKIWDELDKRLGLKIERGSILEKNVIPLRSVVCNTMQYKKLFIAGDAAHIMPPTGAKGMNCAIADIEVLSKGILDYYMKNTSESLNAYSKIALERIWKVVHFSWWMTSTLYNTPNQSDFDMRLQITTLNNICNSKIEGRFFAENFSGIPINF